MLDQRGVARKDQLLNGKAAGSRRREKHTVTPYGAARWKPRWYLPEQRFTLLLQVEYRVVEASGWVLTKCRVSVAIGSTPSGSSLLPREGRLHIIQKRAGWDTTASSHLPIENPSPGPMAMRIGLPKEVVTFVLQ